jgi:hypothetical protein
MFDRRSDLTESGNFSNESAGNLVEGAEIPDSPLSDGKTKEGERRKPGKNEDRLWAYRKGCDLNQAVFDKLLLHKRLTPAGRVVLCWFIKHLGNNNYVGASYSKIAKSAKLSVASVRRGCAVLEDQAGINFMVRVSKSTKASFWLVNPDYFWKGFRCEKASAKATYLGYRKKVEPETHEPTENRDTMPIDFSYLDFDEVSNDEETEPCALKSKAA